MTVDFLQKLGFLVAPIASKCFKSDMSLVGARVLLFGVIGFMSILALVVLPYLQSSLSSC